MDWGRRVGSFCVPLQFQHGGGAALKFRLNCRQAAVWVRLRQPRLSSGRKEPAVPNQPGQLTQSDSKARGVLSSHSSGTRACISAAMGQHRLWHGPQKAPNELTVERSCGTATWKLDKDHRCHTLHRALSLPVLSLSHAHQGRRSYQIRTARRTSIRLENPT